MDNIQRHPIPWIICAAVLSSLGLSSCSVPARDPKLESSPAPVISSTIPNSTPSKPLPPLSPPPLKQPTSTDSTTSVTVYQVDNHCQTLIPQKLVAPTEQALEFAVAQVFELNPNEDFPVAYRLQVDPHHQSATIDFRIPTTAKRPLTALSTCEQLALFGTLRKTLTANSEFQIQQIHFTHQGQDIAL
ncbi:MAG: hypothetical protein ACRC8A_10045 [Microcoleaceae cyanobacterium]